MKNHVKSNSRDRVPPKSPRHVAEEAYMTKVKNLVFKALGHHPNQGPNGWSNGHYNQLVLSYAQRNMDPQQATQAILQKAQANTPK